MEIILSKKFRQQIDKVSRKKQERVREAIKLFAIDPYHPQLRHHSLKGEWLGHYSLSAGGDVRIHFRYLDDETAVMTAVGTHSQLYN